MHMLLICFICVNIIIKSFTVSLFFSNSKQNSPCSWKCAKNDKYWGNVLIKEKLQYFVEMLMISWAAVHFAVCVMAVKLHNGLAHSSKLTILFSQYQVSKVSKLYYTNVRRICVTRNIIWKQMSKLDQQHKTHQHITDSLTIRTIMH